jgi:methyl-accepting chemotaxis protein
MSLLRFIRNMRLGIKLNIVMILAFSLLLVAIVFVVSDSMQDLTFRTGRQRVEQEVVVFQTRFAAAEQSIMEDAKLLASVPGLSAAVATQNLDTVRNSVLVNAALFNFDQVTLVGAGGRRLFDLKAGEFTTEADSAEDALLSFALFGSEIVDLIVEEEGGWDISLAAVVPLYNQSGNIVGALLAGRDFDNEFLAEINLSREDPHFAVIIAGEVMAHDQWNPGEVETFVPDINLVEQVLNGQIAVVEKSITLAGTSYVVGYVPLMVGGRIVGVIAILNDLTVLSNSQNEMMSNMILVIILLGFGAVVTLAFFAWRGITVPLDRLRRVAQQMADDGDYAQRVKTTTTDEIGQLAATLNQMADAVQERQTSERLIRQQLETAVTEYVTFAGGVAAGDLTFRLDLDESGQRGTEDDLYRLGMNFNGMVEGLNQLVQHTRKTAEEVTNASQVISDASEQAAQSTEQVSHTIQQIAEGTAQQTESITRSINTVEQLAQAIDGVARGAQEQAASIAQSVELTANISGSTQQVAANAQTGAAGAAKAAETASSGAASIRETLEGIENIRRKVELSAQKVREMEQRSEHIGTIVDTIDNIASQTNLLALNATIEAARAGEHGKGFAVVADEVRKLAEKSADATKEIGGLIKSIQSTISEAMQAMEDGAAEVEIGVTRANESGQVLDNVLAAVDAVSKQMEEIAEAAHGMNTSVNEMVGAMDTVSAIVEENTAATEEMAASADEVSQAFENIASISEENSAATEEVSATTEEVTTQTREVSLSAQELRKMAQELQIIVAQFKL